MVSVKIGFIYDANPRKQERITCRSVSQKCSVKQKGAEMKRLIFALIVTTSVFVAVCDCAEPGGRRWNRPGGGAPGGLGGGAPRGGRGTPAPPATGPFADMVTKFTDAINKQDAAALQKMVTAMPVLIDEDGHFDPISQWITKLTATGSKS
jgi:hypothetical protein